MLKPGNTKTSIKKNIRTELASGATKKPKQAVAIAYGNAGKSKAKKY